MTTTETRGVNLHSIPRYFGGGANELGSAADLKFEHALLALMALTGRSENDPALLFIVDELRDGVNDLIASTRDFVLTAEDDGLDNLEDEEFMELTGETVPYRELRRAPAPEHWGRLSTS